MHMQVDRPTACWVYYVYTYVGTTSSSSSSYLIAT